MIYIPVGYGRRLMGLDAALERYGVGMEPEYKRRLHNYLSSKGGQQGIGSAWRRTPHPVSAASRAGHSFHQTQVFNDGTSWFCAVDLVCRNGTNVHRAPQWSEVPKQGTSNPDIEQFGVHANIRTETWHLQPVEIDGYQSWVRSGRHRPAPRPLPPPTLPPPTESELPDMMILDLNPGTDWWVAMVLDANTISHIVDGNHVAVLERGGVPRVKLDETELDGVLRSVKTLNASPFGPGPARNDALNSRWVVASA